MGGKLFGGSILPAQYCLCGVTHWMAPCASDSFYFNELWRYISFYLYLYLYCLFQLNRAICHFKDMYRPGVQSCRGQLFYDEITDRCACSVCLAITPALFALRTLYDLSIVRGCGPVIDRCLLYVCVCVRVCGPVIDRCLLSVCVCMCVCGPVIDRCLLCVCVCLRCQSHNCVQQLRSLVQQQQSKIASLEAESSELKLLHSELKREVVLLKVSRDHEMLTVLIHRPTGALLEDACQWITHGLDVAASVIWNSLPTHLRSTFVSREQFTVGLKTHLFTQAYAFL